MIAAVPRPTRDVAPAIDVRLREAALSRVLAAYIGTGLLFMLLPGTFLGVWNLFQVSARESVGLVAPAWLQAHGHAQVFGWVGTFILGIGTYSIPKVRAGARPSLALAWICWALWTGGVAMRWSASVYEWHWRALLPTSAVMELTAFALFIRAVSQHAPPDASRAPTRGFDPWIRIVMSASAGFALTLIMNLILVAEAAYRGESPAIPHGVNQRFLTLMSWGFLAPFVWGFSTKWLPVFLGLRPTRIRVLASGVIVNALAVLATLAGFGAAATLGFVAGAALVTIGLRILEPSQSDALPRTRGVHPSFPAFVRLAYVWLMIAAVLALAAAAWDVSGGIWGASRHAFTVGFISTMVFAIGQRVLPAFAGARVLWSPRLMFAGLLLLATGCVLRVSSEIVAYQGYSTWAWPVLPVSAVLELAAVTAFAFNMAMTFAVER